MKITVEKAGPCRKLMSIDVPPDAVADDYSNILSSYTRAAKLPGFRKGRTPARLVEKRFEKEIEEEARERLVPRFYNEALKQEEIEPVSIVDVSRITFSKNEGLKFSVTLDIAPDFKLPRYRRISVKSKKFDVTDANVSEQLKNLRERMAKFEDAVARPAKKGDLACLDYEGTCEGIPVSELASDTPGLGKGSDFWALLDDPEFLPGLTDHVAGTAVGEKRTVEVAFPPDYRVASMAGRKALYDIELKSIRERILPEIDEEFLKQLGEDSRESLEGKIREQLEEQAAACEKDHLRTEIGKYLVAKTDFDMPQSVIDQETNLMARNMVRQIASGGATQEQIEGQKEVILSEASRSSRDRAKLRYILNLIAAGENIHCDDGELDKRIESMAVQYRMSPGQLKAELEKRNGVESVKSDIRTDKTMDFLLANAKIK